MFWGLEQAADGQILAAAKGDPVYFPLLDKHLYHYGVLAHVFSRVPVCSPLLLPPALQQLPPPPNTTLAPVKYSQGDIPVPLIC